MQPPGDGALTINVGDMMQVWSNDVYRAPLHRVLADRTRRRYSAPFFYNPAHACMVAPIPTSAAAAPRYCPLNWGEFRRRRFEGDYGDYGTEVQISQWRLPSPPPSPSVMQGRDRETEPDQGQEELSAASGGRKEQTLM